MTNRKTNINCQVQSLSIARFLCIVLLSSVTFIKVTAQNTTQVDSSKELPDSTLQYITPLEYAFMMHENTSWLLKGIMQESFDRVYYKLGFEKRIAPSFTLNAGIEYVDDLYGNLFLSDAHGAKESLESRWYYHQNKHIAENKVSRNLSDNYLAFGLDFIHFKEYRNWPSMDSIKNDNYLNYYLKWGMQRRFLKHGFADIGIKTGLTQRLSYDHSISFSFGTFVELGLALTKDHYSLDREKLCPVFKCYETEKYIVKSNIAGLFNVELFLKSKSVVLKPNLAVEHKIASSAFSASLEFEATYRWQNYSGEVYGQQREYHYWNTTLSLEGRWYSTLKRNIRMGKSGNGLSGNYIAAGAYYYWWKNSQFLNMSPEGYPGIYVATGWQKTISKHLYYDIQLGLQYGFTPLLYQREWSPKIDIALGYRF